jgi:hypothetical protein
MRILAFLFFIVSFCGSYWSQKNVVKAMQELDQSNFGSSYQLLQHSLEKHPTAASFGLLNYYLTDYAFNADSAYHYFLNADQYLKVATEKEKEKLALLLNLTDSALNVRLNYLANKELKEVRANASIASLEKIRKRYESLENIFNTATTARDSIAYQDALFQNNSAGFFRFINTYPEAIQIQEAQLKFEELFYLEQTAPNNETVLAQFILKNPNHRYTNQAWQRLYELVKLPGTLEAYTHFVRQYPNSPNLEEAWKQVYKLYMLEYSVERLEAFKHDYPDYPDLAVLEKDGALLLTVLYPWLENGKYGYINQEGRLIINCLYDEASAFYDGAAIVASSGKMGLINKKSETLTPFVFDEIFDPQQRTFIAKKDERYGVLNHLGKLVVALKYKDIQRLENGALMLEDSLGFYLSWADGVLFNAQPMVYEEIEQYLEGQKVTPEVVTAVVPDSNLPIVFIKNGKKGLKLNGKEIVAATFEEILPFQATLAIAKKKGKFGLIDATGKTILNFDYSSVRYLSGLGYLIEQNGLLGIFELNQGFTIPISYEGIKPFEKTYLLVSNAGKDGLLTLTGKQVLDTKYQRIARFDTETLLLVQEDKIAYFLEKENRLIERLP